MNALQEGLERMHAAAATMERTAELMAQAGEAQRIVATADTSREQELERKLEAAERQIAEMRARRCPPPPRNCWPSRGFRRWTRLRQGRSMRR